LHEFAAINRITVPLPLRVLPAIARAVSRMRRQVLQELFGWAFGTTDILAGLGILYVNADAAEIDVLERRIVTIPAKDWEAFEAWAHRRPQKIAALEKLARTDPKWRK